MIHHARALRKVQKQVPTKNQFLFRLDKLGISPQRTQKMFAMVTARIETRAAKRKPKALNFEVHHEVMTARDAFLVAAMNNAVPVNWKMAAMQAVRL